MESLAFGVIANGKIWLGSYCASKFYERCRIEKIYYREDPLRELFYTFFVQNNQYFALLFISQYVRGCISEKEEVCQVASIFAYCMRLGSW